ncbi:MAG: hypothetical protein AAF230_06120 [Pseudomonadota bacterium]
MTTPDPRLCDELAELIEKTPPDRVRRLLDDIRHCSPVPASTHKSTDRLQ